MPRLSLPREAPRVLIPRNNPSKQLDHSFWAGPMTSSVGGATGGEDSLGGIQLSNTSYTDAIHASYFVNKTFSYEVMVQLPKYPVVSSPLQNRTYLLTDQRFRQYTNAQPNGLGHTINAYGAVEWYYPSKYDNGYAHTGTSNTLSSLSDNPREGIWTHYVFVFEHNPSTGGHIARFYVNGYNVNSIQNYFWGLTNSIQFQYSFRKLGALQVCGGTNNIYKYFRVISGNPWPYAGFEIADPLNPFTGSGQWLPGINNPQPYPTVDPSTEIMKFNFQNAMTISDIRDLSLNNWTIDYIAPGASIKYAKAADNIRV